MKNFAKNAYRRLPKSAKTFLRSAGVTELGRRILRVQDMARDAVAPSIAQPALDKFAAGDVAGAYDVAVALLPKYPESARMLSLLADCAYRLGRNTEAEEYAVSALMLGVKDRAAPMIAVRLMQERGAPVGEIMSIVEGSNKAAVYWEACKGCHSVEMLDALEKHVVNPLQDTVPQAKLRPLVVASTRIEEFVRARQYLLRELLILSTTSQPDTLGSRKELGGAGMLALQSAARVLIQAEIPFFAAAGTALGIVREGAPLAHDLDIDIGVFERDFDQEKIKRAFQMDTNFVLDTPHPKNPKVGVKHVSGASIDVFKYYEEGDKFYHNGVFVRWENDAFEAKPYDLGGVTIGVPAPEDKYLTENYGDWRVPDKTFDAFVNGPNRRVLWPEYYGVHLLRAAIGALVAGNQIKFEYLVGEILADASIPDNEKLDVRMAVERMELAKNLAA